jgi:aldehyde:ferredoxin oxidoreductase
VIEQYKLLRIDLAKRTWKEESIPIDIMKQFIGGKGIGTYYLLNEVNPKCDALGPENKLIITLGPLSATGFPTASRWGVLFKSPLTGTYAECYSGGRTAPIMRSTGYFVIIIEGKSESQIYLSISPEKVEFHDAKALWGKDTYEIHDLLVGKTTKTACISIGPAGEKLLKIATIQNDKYHSAARCGPGAVMGSKNLKAILFSGNKKPKLLESQKFKDIVKKAIAKIQEKPDLYGKNGLYRTYGTPSITDWANELGCLPTRYFSACYSEFADRFNGTALVNTILKKQTGCAYCPFGCGKYVEVSEGPFKTQVEGPEYETIAVFGGICDIRDIAAIAKINELCDRYGIDTISAGNLCGLAIEAKLRGKLSMIPDLNINYNDPLSVIQFIHDMVQKDGIAREFAMGTKFVAEKYGLEDFAMHVKGLEFAGYDPRAFRGFALSYGVSPEGPTHLRSTFHSIERNLPNRLSYENKVLPLIEQEDKMAYLDSLILCKFIRNVLDWDFMVEIYNTIFEESIDTPKLREILGNIITMSRIFNVNAGFSKKDDFMPERVYREKLKTLNGSYSELDKEKYEKMLSEYYKMRNWDDGGIPN